eukprot:CAMPEP_0181521362 /NCGR_PEP_ID=MMETSP1110-20121109/66799_1 /TAXON_ID=174948 /ORGANISM="Symbiodinium sp., Strain CCMP421" /LENGTH=35 /DNA_ID= /DNA_START= /DNA_END= /DNA_ORIENTATION=
MELATIAVVSAFAAEPGSSKSAGGFHWPSGPQQLS